MKVFLFLLLRLIFIHFKNISSNFILHMNRIVYYSCFFLLLLFVCFFNYACVKQKLDATITSIDSPTTEDLNDILFVSDSIGFICGGTKYLSGIILKTSNGGLSWTKDTLVSTKALYDIAVYNNKIFTTGYEGFFYSSNNYASSWITPGSPYWQRFNQIAFNQLGECFVAIGEGFDRGEIIYSTNDGAGWSRVDTFNRTIKSIVFHNGIGFAGAYGLIYKSTDNGHSWIPLDTKGDFYNQIIFTSNQVAYAIGYFGKILKSTDGGNTWKQVLNENFSYNEKSNFRDAFFIDDNTGYIVGDNGYIVYTNNGGLKWSQIKTFTDKDIYAIDKVGNNLILVGEQGHIFKLNIDI